MRVAILLALFLAGCSGYVTPPPVVIVPPPVVHEYGPDFGPDFR
jgi:PBP1b-binding outer membrane lipoprotein LpoB